jgi:predicted ArsR family transcriptional regulator
MTPLELAKALIALSNTTVTGVKEAATLFTIASEPMTSQSAIVQTEGRPASTRTRLVNLCDKKLIKASAGKTATGRGNRVYSLTEKGRSLVLKVLK